MVCWVLLIIPGTGRLLVQALSVLSFLEKTNLVLSVCLSRLRFLDSDRSWHCFLGFVLFASPFPLNVVPSIETVFLPQQQNTELARGLDSSRHRTPNGAALEDQPCSIIRELSLRAPAPCVEHPGCCILTVC